MAKDELRKYPPQIAARILAAIAPPVTPPLSTTYNSTRNDKEALNGSPKTLPWYGTLIPE